MNNLPWGKGSQTEMNIFYIANFRQVRKPGMLKEGPMIQKDLGKMVRDESIKVGRGQVMAGLLRHNIQE